MPRIALLDDHPIVRRGFKQLIESVPGHVVLIEHSHAEELLADPELVRCDLLVLDISLPQVDGFDVLRRLSSLPRSPRVLVLSMHEELPYVREAFSLGAGGYLSKAGADEELIDALLAIADGGTYIGASLRERLSAIGPGRDLAFPELTERECEIVRMLVNGANIRQISEQLNTSRKTVYAHRSRMFQKLRITTDVELVQLAGRRGLPGPG